MKYIFILTFLISFCFSQDIHITGILTDENNNPVSNANVKLKSNNMAFVYIADEYVLYAKDGDNVIVSDTIIDTVVIIDTITNVDTEYVVDTITNIDTVTIIDTITNVDTEYVVDTITIIDTNRITSIKHVENHIEHSFDVYDVLGRKIKPRNKFVQLEKLKKSKKQQTPLYKIIANVDTINIQVDGYLEKNIPIDSYVYTFNEILTSIIFEETFNNGYDRWTVTNANSVEVKITAGYLQMSDDFDKVDNPNKNPKHFYVDLDSIKPTTISFDMNWAGTEYEESGIICNGVGGAFPEMFTIRFLDDDFNNKSILMNDGRVDGYVSNQWFHYDIIFDWSAQSYTLYKNGTLLATHYFVLGPTSLTQLRFYMHNFTVVDRFDIAVLRLNNILMY